MRPNSIPTALQASSGRHRSRVRLVCGLLALAATLGALASCGGGGGGGATPAVPLVWDGAQATWDNVTWQ